MNIKTRVTERNGWCYITATDTFENWEGEKDFSDPETIFLARARTRNLALVYAANRLRRIADKLDKQRLGK